MTTHGIHYRLSRERDRADADWLASRASRTLGSPSVHQQARTELGLWRAALAAELAQVTLTLPQAQCIADVIGGPVMAPAVAAGGLGTVYRACRDAFDLARARGGEMSSYGARHGTGEAELLRCLLSLGPAADHALMDALSRWRARNLDATAEGFAAAGLRVR